MKIIFLSTRQTKPSYRFRVENILPFFRDRGHVCDTAFLPAGSFDRLRFYRREIHHDLVFVQKRLLNPAELTYLRLRAPRLVYDLDDAIMHDGDGSRDSRRQRRFRSMAETADLVICGNEYLEGEARQHTSSVCCVPTPIDTQRFRPSPEAERSGPVTIGWTGSSSTNRYLNDILKSLSHFAGRIQLVIISDSLVGLELNRLEDVSHIHIPWSPDVEVSEAARFDIGLMPLPDNPWTRGKCGFKALQYMSLGLPAVCSPVGVNRKIVRHGETGYLADTPEQWNSALETLINDRDRRNRMGEAGRLRVVREYSLNVLGPRMVDAVEGTSSVMSRAA